MKLILFMSTCRTDAAVLRCVMKPQLLSSDRRVLMRSSGIMVRRGTAVSFIRVNVIEYRVIRQPSVAELLLRLD